MSAPRLDGDAALLERIRGWAAAVRPGRIGVAVSGGGDSVALLHLAVRVGAQAGAVVAAVTVDHRLRPGSAAEAAEVGALCARLGVAHDIVTWHRADPRGNLQAEARAARYALMGRWAAERGIAHMLLGHTADDAAETFLLRLARRSGVDGLARMAERIESAGVAFHRPLLDMRREALRAYLRRHGVRWSEDPGNDDVRFDRVRARRALAVLTELGIGADALGTVAAHLAEVRDAVARATRDAAARMVTQEDGDLLIGRDALAAAPPEIARRIAVGAVRWIGGAPYPPRRAATARLVAALAAGECLTLGGCVVRPACGGRVRVTREYAAVRESRADPATLWDGRWRIDGAAPGTEIRALGPDGLAQLPQAPSRGRPHLAWRADPALWRGAALVAAPTAGHPAGCLARLAAGRDDFVGSLASH